MKRILTAFLLSVFGASASAALLIDVNVLDNVITNHFAADDTDATAAAQAYLDMIQDGGGVTVDGLYRVCVAGGFDIKTTDGKDRCDKFVTDLLSQAALDYYAVCSADSGKSGGKEYCIEGVFENGWAKTGDGYDLNTGIMQGQAFGAAYIKHKYKIDAVCSKKIRTAGNDDFLKCTSLDNKTFFELRFDDLMQSLDAKAEKNQKYAICHVYGLKKAAEDITNIGCEAASATACEQLKPLANKLAYDVVFEKRDLIITVAGTANRIPTNGCWFANRRQEYTSDGKFDDEKLAKIDGLNNRQFYGIHSLNTNIQDAVREYVRGVKGANAVVECNDNTTKIPSASGKMDNDEVLRCTVNGAPIDFIFDDTSELFGYERRAGESGLSCASLGGTYTGEACINIDGAAACNALKSRLQAACPTCKAPTWSESENRCYLPDSNNADNINFSGKIGAIAVGSVVVGAATVAITVFTGGTGLAVALAVVETVGGVGEVIAEITIGRDATQFLAQTAKCGGASCGGCAGELLGQLHTHVAQAPDYQPVEINAIDTEMERLLNCLSTDEQKALGLAIENGILDANQGITGEWTPAQITRALSIGAQLSSLVYGVGRVVYQSVKHKSGLIKTARTLNRMESIAATRKANAAARLTDAINAANQMTDAQRANVDNKVFDILKDAYTNSNRGKGALISLNGLSPTEEGALRAMLDELGASGIKYSDEIDPSQGRVLRISDKDYKASKLNDLGHNINVRYKQAQEQIHTAYNEISGIWGKLSGLSSRIKTESGQLATATTIESAERYAMDLRLSLEELQAYAMDATEKFTQMQKQFVSWEEEFYFTEAQKLLDQINTDARSAHETLDALDETLDAQKLKINQDAATKAASDAHTAREKEIGIAITYADARRTNTHAHVTKPVSYSRQLPRGKGQEVMAALQEAGIHVSFDVTDKTAWVIRTEKSGNVVLQSPYLSPETAPETANAVFDLLRRKNIISYGPVNPSTIEEIDPTVVTGLTQAQGRKKLRDYVFSAPELKTTLGVTEDLTDEQVLARYMHHIRKKEALEGNITDIRFLASSYDDQDVLYRGQKFATSDASSAFANPSTKGTTGNPLGTKDAADAVRYTGADSKGVTGAGVTAREIGEIKVQGDNVGFLSVHKASDNDVFYGDLAVERMNDFGHTETWYTETLINPTDNPVIDRYVFINGVAFKIDEDNPEHLLLLDAFAPDLSKTYDAPMLQRIESVKDGMVDGVPQTYDLEPEVLQRLIDEENAAARASAAERGY